MSVSKKKEGWNSRIGVILAVAGSAVGLGNFLRFPGQAAEHGGGAFMVAYFISLLIIGLPICWAEWTMGRYGGRRGFHSSPGVLNAVTCSPFGRYAGVIGVIIPVIIYMYYVYIEAWCLGYAVNFLRGDMQFTNIEESAGFWGTFIGVENDGDAIGFGIKQVGMFLVACFILNFFLIYRGVSKGIEFFCKYAMPALVIMALVILVRVLTLSPPDDAPESTVSKGLGYMWNPDKIILKEAVGENEEGKTIWKEKALLRPAEYKEQVSMIEADGNLMVVRTRLSEKLQNPEIWLAAAGQIFFSLSIGFGVIITYSSYLKRKDDVVLSGLSATSANEFCEVGLGGLITVPAAFVFLGLAGVAANSSTFDLGFKVLPMVFSQMPAGNFFGFVFFFLLFLAAVTSSLSMLQPGIAFLEETLNIGRKQSVAILGFITAIGSGVVVFFSKGVAALDTLDFWVGTFLIFVYATIQIILFGWVLGLKKGMAEAHEGASIRIPKFFGFFMKYVTPAFLLTIFVAWMVKNVFGIGSDSGPSSSVKALIGYGERDPDKAAWIAIGLVVLFAAFVVIIVSMTKQYEAYAKNPVEPKDEA